MALSLIVLFFLVDLGVVVDCIVSIPLSMIAILVAVSLFQTWMASIRWRWVHPDESKQLSSWQYFRLMMVSKPFNLIMPGAFGGDLVRTALTIKTVQSNRVNNVIAIVADRFIALLSIIFMGGIALFFISDVPDKQTFYALFGTMVGGLLIVLLMISNARLLQFAQLVFSRLGNSGTQLLHLLETWKKALRFFRCNYASLLKALMLCLPIHGLSFLAGYLLSEILGMGISIFDISMSLSLAWIVTAIPITISGLGVRELSLIYLLSFYNVAAESATALSIYLHIIQVIMGLIGLVLLFTTKSSLQLSETKGGFSTENTD